MGQQQLLLLVLAVIIVGVSIVAGIGIFHKNAEKANIDMVVNEVVEMSGIAHQYYLKPPSMGGGGESFTGLKLIDLTGSHASPINTSFQLVITNAQQIVITASCGQAKRADGSAVDVICTVTPDSIVTAVKN